jgi:CRISPR-associated endonuclease Csn1
MNSKNYFYRLGLDLGTNSIGWSAIELNQENQPQKILKLGTRIFSDGRDPQKKEPLAVARRIARGMRRRRDRMLSRKNNLLKYLIKINLMPSEEIERKKLELLNPYQLRYQAINQELNPSELARAIFHLVQRRGFKSNRKEISNQDTKKTEDENSKPIEKKPNSKLSDQDKRDKLTLAIQENNCQTLGEFLYKNRLLNGQNVRGLADNTDFYPTREMYLEEFKKIKNFQQKFHKISEENWQKIEEIIFFQRKLKEQDLGFCRFINIYKLQQNKLPDWAIELLNNRNQKQYQFGLPRAYLALPSYCKFRILSEVNNLKLKNKITREIIELTIEQKEKIIEKLNSQKSNVKFQSIRKLISNKQISYAGNDFEFNLESDRRPELQANPTNVLLSDEKYFGKNWQNISLEKQDKIVEFLITEDEENTIKLKALNEWNLSEEQAINLSKLTINNFSKTGVGNICKELLQKLCHELENKNCNYYEACKFLGIDHSDETIKQNYDKLPYYGQAIPASVVAVKMKTASKDEQDFGKIANPTVHCALNQLRKVVNSIIDEFGKPDEIHVELARDLKQTKDEKRQTKKNQDANEKLNKEAKEKIAELGYAITTENITKYKLWKELNPNDCNDRKCVYTGKTISASTLFSHEFEIEHILPFSKTLDDSIANKTLAHKSANAKKGNRSPFEAFGSNHDGYDYQEILRRSKNLPKNKRWRFEEKAMEKFNDQNEFLSRQLNDTRYISKIARQYLECLLPREKIAIGNGKLTSILRHNWGLNSILNPQDSELNQSENIEQDNLIDQYFTQEIIDPETGEVSQIKVENKLKDNSNKSKNKIKKNRDDHRHHAIDAVCIAMTDRKLLQQISRDNARGFDISSLGKLPNHWNSFREDVVEAVDKIIVSHKTDHGKNTKLHDETNYGKLKNNVLVKNNKKNPANCNLVIKAKIISLKRADCYYVRDEKIRNLLLIEASKASSDKEFQEKILPEFSKKTGIKKIRLYDNNNSILEISHPQNNPKFTKIVKTNGNNHIALWQLPNGEYFTDIVSNIRVNCPYKIETKSDGVQFINKKKKYLKNEQYEKLKPHPSAKLIIKLFKEDLIKLEENGMEKVVVLKVIGSTSQCYYMPHNIGNVEKESKESEDKTTKNEEQNLPKEKIKGSFNLNKKTLLQKKLRKIFITPSGKIYDSGPILKKIN